MSLKVYIGTLFVGENELEDCLESVRRQSYKAIFHEVFRNLPNLEAHRTLFSRFMELDREYDIFIKLDADMVMTDPDMVSKIATLFETIEDFDHGIFLVQDWYSQSDIMGLHVYSKKARWLVGKDELFVDPNPDIPGKRLKFTVPPAPVALHNPNPSLEFAYLFGFHRALKIVQRDRFRKTVGTAELQLNLLKATWNELKKTTDIRRAAVIQGANDVFRSRVKHMEDKRSECSFNAAEFARRPVEAFIKQNSWWWDGPGYYLRTIWQYGLVKFFILKPYQVLKGLRTHKRTG